MGHDVEKCCCKILNESNTISPTIVKGCEKYIVLRAVYTKSVPRFANVVDINSKNFRKPTRKVVRALDMYPYYDEIQPRRQNRKSEQHVKTDIDNDCLSRFLNSTHVITCLIRKIYRFRRFSSILCSDGSETSDQCFRQNESGCEYNGGAAFFDFC